MENTTDMQLITDTTKMKEIAQIEERYGLMIFTMALTYIMDIGIQNRRNIKKCLEKVELNKQKDKKSGVTGILTPEHEHEIINCAMDLSNFNSWVLIKYLKNNLVL